MKKIHVAISTNELEGSIEDYTQRLGVKPCAIVKGEYALWRTDILNLSIRNDSKHKPGELRHLGWEDASASEFLSDTDVNGILWERFNARQQADEINEAWPGTNYDPYQAGSNKCLQQESYAQCSKMYPS